MQGLDSLVGKFPSINFFFGEFHCIKLMNNNYDIPDKTSTQHKTIIEKLEYKRYPTKAEINKNLNIKICQ